MTSLVKKKQIPTTQELGDNRSMVSPVTAICVGRFRIFGGGGQGLEYWGAKGGNFVSTSCANKAFNKSVPNNYISHLKI